MGSPLLIDRSGGRLIFDADCSGLSAAQKAACDEAFETDTDGENRKAEFAGEHGGRRGTELLHSVQDTLILIVDENVVHESLSIVASG